MSQATADRPRSNWIVSPRWDLLYVVATPLLIMPVVALLAHRVFSPEQIALVVVAFASIGHHLPGFMRCYGDRDLFARFRWRFLLAPPLLLVISSLFVFNGLHGLELIVLFWATWHGLMQIYGFMRIYDLKRGIRDALTARLDLFLCFMLFAAGLLCSDARVYSIMELFWLSGLPPVDSVWLTAIRTVVVTLTAASIIAFLIHEYWLGRKLGGMTWPKILLALSTGLIYWGTGTLSTNMIIGVAMFEVFHAVQYYAIVWVYNRKIADRVGKRSGFIGFLFRDRWAFVGLYLAAIAAFGSIQLFSEAIHQPVIRQLLIAFLSASAILHFYYDGFIWKVREKKTQENLDIDGGTGGRLRTSVPAVVHLGKWAILLVVASAFFVTESQARNRGPKFERQLLENLAAWTPAVPELQIRLARQATADGDYDRAISLSKSAVDRRPRSHEAHAALATAFRHKGKYEAAAERLQTAVELAPGNWENHLDLALTLVSLKDWADAERHLKMASELEPTATTMNRAWGAFYSARGEHVEASSRLWDALEGDPTSQSTRIQLVNSLSSSGDHSAAIQVASEGVTRQPKSAVAHAALGRAYNAARQFAAALKPLGKSLQLDPENAEALYHSGLALVQQGHYKAAVGTLRKSLMQTPNNADAHFQLGNAYFFLEDLDAAAENYQNCVRLDPRHSQAFNALGATFTMQNDLSGALRVYKRAISLNPKHAASHYNLGLWYYDQQRDEEAKEFFQKAWDLGMKPHADIIAELGLEQPTPQPSDL